MSWIKGITDLLHLRPIVLQSSTFPNPCKKTRKRFTISEIASLEPQKREE